MAFEGRVDDERVANQLLKKENLDWIWFIAFVTDCAVSRRNGRRAS
jgi:hypothetical protein